MRPSRALTRLVASQRDLGPFLRFEVLVPFTVLVCIVGGKLLTLPPGPLCDEGMVLFMEGGCDWGWSNVFFFAKVSLLVSANLAMVACWLRPPAAWGGFSVHFALLGLLGWVWRSGADCETYYSHPNGSLGQMILEMACFSIFGVALARASVTASWPVRGAALAAWNGFHVGMFYLFLNLLDHWTWGHTGLVAGSQLAAAAPLFLAVPRADVTRGRRAPDAAAPDGAPDGAAADDPAAGLWRGASLFFIAAAFVLTANPFGIGRTATTAGAVGLIAGGLVGVYAGRRAAWAAGLLAALALPAHGFVRGSLDYREQSAYAATLLGGVDRLTLQDADRLADAALAFQPEGRAVGRDLVLDRPEAAEIAGRALAPGVELRQGTLLSLLVPLPDGRYARLYRGRWSDVAVASGDVIRLVSEHGELAGYEFVLELQAAGRRRAVSWWSYVVDTTLRRLPPEYQAGRALRDGDGRARALLVAGTKPRRP